MFRPKEQILAAGKVSNWKHPLILNYVATYEHVYRHQHAGKFNKHKKKYRNNNKYTLLTVSWTCMNREEKCTEQKINEEFSTSCQGTNLTFQQTS